MVQLGILTGRDGPAYKPMILITFLLVVLLASTLSPRKAW